MVKICVVSAEGLKDNKEKVEGLPDDHEILTDIPLYEKYKLEDIDDLATIKNPKRRCKGFVIILLLVILAISCLCLATLVCTISEDDDDDQDVIEYQETHRFDCEIIYRDQDNFFKDASKQPETTAPYHSTVNPDLHHMKEEIIVGNSTEVFTIPPGEDHEALIILHDFSNKYTAYLLVEQDLCFVKYIDPFLLNPFVFMLFLMNPLNFAYEYVATRETFIAVPPPLDSLWSFGPEVERHCGNAVTFWLEEMNDEYETVDIADLPWLDWGYPERYNRRRRSVGNPKKLQFFDGKMHEAKILFKNPSVI